MTTVITVANEHDLDQAIATVDSATSGSFEIDFATTIYVGPGLGGQVTFPAGAIFSTATTETAPPELYAINLQTGVSLTINGETHQLNGTTIQKVGNTTEISEERGLFIYSGNVTIEHLQIANSTATGGAGGSAEYAGGGGAGLGGGLFVASGGNVTLNDVNFTSDSAVGGAGGIYDGATNDGGNDPRDITIGGGGGLGGAGGDGLKGVGYSLDGGPLGDGGGGGVGSTAAGGGTSGSPYGMGIIPGAGSGFGGGHGVQGGTGGVPGTNFGGGDGTFAYEAGGSTGGFGGGGATNAYSLSGGAVEGGDGGFGGGGSDNGFGGYGGGSGTNAGKVAVSANAGGGGGGAGLGGAVFVQAGGKLSFTGGYETGSSETGGAGSDNAGNGIGKGAVFLQGATTLTLTALAGQTLRFAGTVVTTQESSLANVTELVITGPGTVALASDNTIKSDVLIEGGTLELDGQGLGYEISNGVVQNLIGGGNVVFSGAPATLKITDQTPGDTTPAFGSPVEYMVSVENFSAAGETIDLSGLAYRTGDIVTLTTDIFGHQVLRLQEPLGAQPLIYDLPVTGTMASSYLVVNDGAGGTAIEVNPACYLAGTAIRTAAGEAAVETLTAGDLVVTHSGEYRPVKWIGVRSYAGRFLAANPKVQPVRFRAGSLGDGLPRRDLLVSPEHAMFIDGVLIPARCLVNGATVVRDRVERVNYFHVELDTHDVLLAEGAPSESFMDDESRGVFHNAHEFDALYPDAARPIGFCAPRVEQGAQLEAIRQRLASVAAKVTLAA